MPPVEFRILAINPGSTSTKLAVYASERPMLVKNIRHSEDELEVFRGRPMLDQCPLRLAAIQACLAEAGITIESLSAIAGRGGLLPPLASGTYLVDGAMLEELRLARRGDHASNLGAVLAKGIADLAGVRAFVVDPVSVDELPPHARLSGSALLERQCLSHALNSKAVAKRFAREQGKEYSSLRLIVAHLGSGITISTHENGRMVEVTNSREEGAFSTERAGSVPCMQLVDMCFSGKYTKKQVETLLFREGGLFSYLGTKDLAAIEDRIEWGDAKAKAVFDAMIYQIAKEIGAATAVLKGRVDALLFTGGMAHSIMLVQALQEYVNWAGPIEVFPGEDELQALAEGVLRVLRGEEPAQRIAPASLSVAASIR